MYLWAACSTVSFPIPEGCSGCRVWYFLGCFPVTCRDIIVDVKSNAIVVSHVRILVIIEYVV